MLPEFFAWVRKISIHALREEGDWIHFDVRTKKYNFYPRPPRGGRHIKLHKGFRHFDISIHALREEGDAKTKQR